HLCKEAQPTVVGHRGGFATRVRAQWPWVIPLPAGLGATDAGPFLCGGVTVFSPLAAYAKPTDRVGIVGIGGLGHMAVKLAVAFGCHITAFVSPTADPDDARRLGAHEAVFTADPAAAARLAARLALLISTVNVKLDWDAMIGPLAPTGRLHVVGAVLEPIPVAAFSLILPQRSVSGSPTGSPATIAKLLDFAARHRILPQTEHFPMSRVNEGLARLASGKARYRVVFAADFSGPAHGPQSGRARAGGVSTTCSHRNQTCRSWVPHDLADQEVVRAVVAHLGCLARQGAGRDQHLLVRLEEPRDLHGNLLAAARRPLDLRQRRHVVRGRDADAAERLDALGDLVDLLGQLPGVPVEEQVQRVDGRARDLPVVLLVEVAQHHRVREEIVQSIHGRGPRLVAEPERPARPAAER